MKKALCLGIYLLGAFIGLGSADACTDFRISAQDRSTIITRSMEFALDLNSNLMSSPRGRSINNLTNEGKPALSWKSQYGYVFLDGLDSGVAVDGINEQGLSVEALLLPRITQYQNPPAGAEDHAIPYLRFGDWILGNFKTVNEVRQALPGIFVFAQKIPQAKDMIFPLHYAIYDASGDGIVVEFTNGKMQVFDNKIGILTNAPTYDWHMTNLQNYLNLSPTNPKPVMAHGLTFVATGQGAGMLGLPGDISPPSRFVKMSVMLKTALGPKNADEAVNLAQHIINNVDIPLGFVREPQNLNQSTDELTQWVVFKDLTNKKFYYRTYRDLALHLVDLNQINLSEGAPILKMPINSSQSIVMMTNRFNGSKY